MKLLYIGEREQGERARVGVSGLRSHRTGTILTSPLFTE